MLKRGPMRRLFIWSSVIGVFALAGIGVEQRLHFTDLRVPGAPSDKAQAFSQRSFGNSSSLAVLFTGPPAQIGADARRFASQLARERDLVATGPWAPGSGRSLRPAPNKALVFVRSQAPNDDTIRNLVPLVERRADAAAGPRAHAYVTGFPTIAKAQNDEALKALERAELIAAPVLLIVLLLIFRSPVAAGLPLLLGFMDIGAIRGLLGLVNKVTPLDAASLNLASMMGLALGVDYALLFVSRYREELRGGASREAAIEMAKGTAGRTIVFAGIAMAAATLSMSFVAPTHVIASGTIGVCCAVVVSVPSALAALPPLLAVIGPRLDKWSIGRATTGGAGRTANLAVRALRRPALASVLVLALLGLVAAPAIAMDMGPPHPDNLPPSNRERQAFDKFTRNLSNGWSAPYEVTVASTRGPVTAPKPLGRIVRYERQVAALPHISAVMGPAPIAAAAARTRSRLSTASGALKGAGRKQAQLAQGLARASGGAQQLDGGLAAGAAGAQRLARGGSAAVSGAQRLGTGLGSAAAGAGQLVNGIHAASRGAGAFAGGTRQAGSGSRQLVSGLTKARSRTARGIPRVHELGAGLSGGAGQLDQLREPAQIAARRLDNALSDLNAMSILAQRDPRYRDAYNAVADAQAAVTGRDPRSGAALRAGYPGLDASLATASGQVRTAAGGVTQIERNSSTLVAGLARLQGGAAQLQGGIARLEGGANQLDRGLGRLEGGGTKLDQGVARLQAGASALASGAGSLGNGANALAQGLSNGARQAQPLASGIEQMHAGVEGSRAQTASLQKAVGSGAGPQLFQSGYAVLAGVDSAPPVSRTAATFALNLDRGGTAAHLVVIESFKGATTRSDDPVRRKLDQATAALDRTPGLDARLGGPAVTLEDFEHYSRSRFPLMVLTLLVVSYLVLVPLLRSLALPLIAVLLNLATVAAAFGVLTVLFTGSAPLGGSGRLDSIMVLAIFSIVFGLSIDYEVFLLARMREGWLRERSTEAAVEYGLRTTAGVITGAAAIMAAVFAAFALAPIASMRELGIGLTVAVLLDTTLVRLVLLPALIRLLGERAWWFPKALERRLPDVDVEVRRSSGRFRRPASVSRVPIAF